MGERLVIPFENVVKSKGGAVVLTDGKACGVRSAVAGGKSRANATRVTQVAEQLLFGFVRLRGVSRVGMARARPCVAQWQ